MMSDYKLPRIRKSLIQDGTARGLRAVRGAVVGVIVARHLGPENFGIYSFALSIVAIAGITFSMGVDQILMKLLSQIDCDEKTLISRGLRIRACGLGLSLLILATFLCLRPQSWGVIYIIIAFLAGEFAKVLMIKQLALQARHQFREIAKADIIALSTGAAIALAGVILDWPIWSFALAISIDAWIFTLLLWIIPVKDKFQAPVNTPTVKHLMREGLPFLLAGFAVILYLRVDLVMLEQMVGSRVAGLYATSVRTCEVFLLAPITFVSVMTPRLYAASSDEIQERFRSALIWMFRICTAAILIGLIVGVPLFPIIYSENYKEAAPVFACLLPSVIAVGAGQLAMILIVRSSSRWIIASSACITAALNIGLNIVLIPILGMYGAALATLISYPFAAIIPLCIIREHRWAFVLTIKALKLF